MKKHRTLEQTEPFLNKLQIIMNSFEKQSNKIPYLLYLVVSKEILPQLNLSVSMLVVYNFGIINFYADLLRICCCGYERCALMSSEQKITVYSSNYAIINLDYISSTHNTLSKDKV